eukprot:753888-Hanusia_phi.AAC.5
MKETGRKKLSTRKLLNHVRSLLEESAVRGGRERTGQGEEGRRGEERRGEERGGEERGGRNGSAGGATWICD